MATGRHKIFVGVDYGTTFSGIAYALPTAADGRDVEVVTEWPGRAGRNNEFLEKVPSIIAYFHENEASAQEFGFTGDLWGYEVKPGLVSCSWTKLLLDKDARGTKYDDSNLAGSLPSGLFRLPPGKSPIDVTTDYLTKLYEHCIKTLDRLYADLLIVTPIEFWFTMPAMWSDKAQNATKKAARKAGFGTRAGDTVKMITEPEAGVLEAIRTRSKAEGVFERNTGLVVCDCGGGTVDLTSYVVMNTEPKLELREACAGLGGKCGSTSVDRNFYALMCDRFGEAFTKLPSIETGPDSKLMRQFEGVKKEFDGRKLRPEGLSLQMNVDPSKIDASKYDRGEIKLSSDDVQECFDPVVTQIIALIAQQKRDSERNGNPKIEKIVLLGGFGSSNYLWERIRKWADQNGKIQCITTQKCWSAIARGAALRGLEGSKVPLKKCRRHYGITYDRPFDPALDDENDETWPHPRTKKTMVRHCMKWYFEKNEEIASDTSKKIHYDHHHEGHKNKKATLNIYSSTLNRAPAKKTGLVDLVGTVEVNLKDVDLESCETTTKQPSNKPKSHRKQRDEDELVYLVEFTAIITLGGEEGTMEVAVMWNDKKCGSGVFKFVHDKA